MATAEAPQVESSFAGRVVDLTNAERQKVGLGPLTINPELQDAAQAYSDVLASSNCFNHTCGAVPSFAERDSLAGYAGWTALAENIAAGYATPEEVVAGWMASPGHRANMLSPKYSEMGVGVSSSDGKFGTHWTEEFGQRAVGVSLESAE